MKLTPYFLERASSVVVALSRYSNLVSIVQAIVYIGWMGRWGAITVGE